ncbi:glycosyltransferase [Ideonella sp.]|jgi:hypothetical protein|uniref:glycosyltransferase n=1 Tax=Ideonella sp. TaxID=1929293 RepID=UPI0037C03704
MPLITTLIPAYKKDFLGEVFGGLARQSFKDFQVIVSDDSPKAEITRLIRDGHYGPAVQQLQITVVRGPCNARRNHERLIDLWAGQTPLVHFHLDDDLIYPEFYRHHVEAHATGRYSVSITPRWLGPANGKPAWTLPLPDFVEASPLHRVPVDAELMFRSTVPRGENWVGELNNLVFSAEAALAFPRPPAQGLSYYGLMDISAVLEAVKLAPAIFVRDHQSLFRQHDEQNTRSVGTHGHRVCMLVWAAMALHAWQEQRLSAQEAVQGVSLAVRRCLALYGEGDPVMDAFYSLVQEHGTSLPQLHQAFTRFWLGLLASHPSTTAAAKQPAAATAPAAAALA